MFARLVASAALTVISMALGIAVMVFGWGLKPVSWWWIIGGGIGLRGMVAVLEAVVKLKKDD